MFPLVTVVVAAKAVVVAEVEWSSKETVDNSEVAVVVVVAVAVAVAGKSS